MRISLFGAVKLTKTNDPDKYKYFGHGTGFDVCGFFFFSDGGGFSQNVIFGVDMSFSLHIENENKKKDILILGKSSPGGLDTTALSIEKYIL